MTAIIKNNFRLQNARDFVENFTAARHTQARNHYLFVGKPTVWGTGSQGEELSPIAPQDTKFEEQRVWDEMLSLKKIDDAYVSLVVRRSNWQSGVVYAIYDDADPFLYSQPTQARQNALPLGVIAGNFYVITDEFDIFICLSNNNNAASTVKPIRPTTPQNLVEGADGYIWKYVASVKSSDVTKFVTDSWIPVKTLTTNPGDGSAQWVVQENSVPGQVLSVQVTNGGSGYTGVFTGNLVGGTIANTGGVGVAQLSTGADASTDFYNGAHLHVTSGANNGAIYRIASYVGGGFKTITLTEPWATSGGSILIQPGDQIQILPRLDVISNGTSPVKFRPVVVSGSISKVQILSAGANASFVSISVANGLGGSGAIVRPVLSDYFKGLGKDIEKDLNANFVMLNARLTYNEGETDFPQHNDYRQLGIIRDVKAADGNLATSLTLRGTKKLTLSNIQGGTLTFDEIIQTGPTGIKARVLDFVQSGSTGTLTFIQTPTTGYGNFTVGSQIFGTSVSPAFQATIDSIEGEEITKRSGEILYLENRRAVLRSTDQIEDIKAIVEF